MNCILKKIVFCGAFVVAISPVQSQEKLTYTIVKDAPELREIANIYFSPQLILDMPMYSTKFDEGLSSIESITIGLGGNLHAIVFEKFLIDANYLHPSFSSLLGKTRKFEIGGGFILSSSTKSSNLNLPLESKEVGSYTQGDKRYTTTETKFITIPAKIHKYTSARAGIYSAKKYFTGEIDDNKMEGYNNFFGVYGGLSFAKITNVQAKVSNYKYLKNVQTYGRYYLDVIIAPGFVPSEGYVEGNSDISSPSPLGFRLGKDMYKPTTGFMSFSSKWEVGYQPGYNGFYALVGFGFTMRGKINALTSKTPEATETPNNQ